jgi:methylamine dehydrogenase accessory protein MauD
MSGLRRRKLRERLAFGSVTGWWTASYIVLWFLVIVLCVVVVALARQIGTLHLRLGPRGALELDDEGPPLGEAPPPLGATDLTGSPVTIGGAGEPQLLLFVSPTCRVCEDLLPATAVVAAKRDLVPYVITDADEAGAARLLDRKPKARVVSSAEATRRYAVPGTPYAVVLDSSGVVRAKGTVNNLEQMEGLVETARSRGGERRVDR